MGDELEVLIATERTVHRELLTRKEARDRPLKDRLALAQKEKAVFELKLKHARAELHSLEAQTVVVRGQIASLSKGPGAFERFRARVLEPVVVSASLFLSLLSFGLVKDGWRLPLLFAEAVGLLSGTSLFMARARKRR